MQLIMDKIRKQSNRQIKYSRNPPTFTVQRYIYTLPAVPSGDRLICSVQALKALSLLRMGRGEEGARLVDTVILAHPGDSATLQALFMYCRETDDCMLP